MEGAYLVQPIVEVLWGTLNLTSPSASSTPTFEGIDLTQIGPLVYDVRVSMEDQGQTPTGSMKWNPSALAFSVYEKCVEKFTDYSIIITFQYPEQRSRSISFQFYWAGQTETVGSEMDINVKLVSMFDGLINANFYSYIQTDREEKGVLLRNAFADLMVKFGLTTNTQSATENLLGISTRTSVSSAEILDKTIIKSNYNDGSNFMDSVQNLFKVTGLQVFFSNFYDETNPGPNPATMTVYSPYSTVSPEEIQLASTKAPTSTVIRYVFLLVPSMFQSFTRNYEWQPPQKSQEITSLVSRKIESLKKSAEKSTDSNPDNSKNANKGLAGLPEGVYQGKLSNGVTLETAGKADNEYGPRNQDLFNKEKAAKLSFTTYMCPILVGIKPLDVIVIPEFRSNFLEDWVVTSVEYQQTSGGVDVAIQASRKYGDKSPMNKEGNNQADRLKKALFIESELFRSFIDPLNSFLDYSWGGYTSSFRTSAPRIAGSEPSPTSPESAPSGEVTEGTADQAPVSEDQQVRNLIDNKWPAQLTNGKQAYEVRSDGTSSVTYFRDPAFALYTRYYYGIEKPDPAVTSRIESSIRGKPRISDMNVSGAEAKVAYQSYVNGGRTRMLNYYQQTPGGLRSLVDSAYFTTKQYDTLFKPGSFQAIPSPKESPLVVELRQTSIPVVQQQAPTTQGRGTTPAGTTVQPSTTSPTGATSPTTQSTVTSTTGPTTGTVTQAGSTIQPTPAVGVVTTTTPVNPPKPTEPVSQPAQTLPTTPIQSSSAELRSQIEKAFPANIGSRPTFLAETPGQDTITIFKINDPLFYTFLGDKYYKDYLSKSVQFLGEYRIQGLSLGDLKELYSRFIIDGRSRYLDTKQGEGTLEEVLRKARAGGS